jgi:hypothetical protein
MTVPPGYRASYRRRRVMFCATLTDFGVRIIASLLLDCLTFTYHQAVAVG